MAIAIGKAGFWAGLVGFERDRCPLWLPVFLGVGAGLYFALPVEPGAAAGWLTLAAGLCLAVSTLLVERGRMLLALTAALALGFGAAKLREMRVAAPVIKMVRMRMIISSSSSSGLGRSGCSFPEPVEGLW